MCLCVLRQDLVVLIRESGTGFGEVTSASVCRSPAQFTCVHNLFYTKKCSFWLPAHITNMSRLGLGIGVSACNSLMAASL